MVLWVVWESVQGFHPLFLTLYLEGVREEIRKFHCFVLSP